MLFKIAGDLAEQRDMALAYLDLAKAMLKHLGQMCYPPILCWSKMSILMWSINGADLDN